MNPDEILYTLLCAGMIAILFALFYVRERMHTRNCRRAFAHLNRSVDGRVSLRGNPDA